MRRQGTVAASGPTVWRRWLANEMRRLRRTAGLEQKDVADKLRCTVSKVSYVESGERAFRPRDLTEILLPLYGIPEHDWDRYVEACKRSRERGWWQHYDEDTVADWVSYYIGLEQGAQTLCGFEMQYPPGLFQTESYARALMSSDPARLSDDEIAARLEVRHRRQAVLTRTHDPLRVAFVMDEAVLRRVVGSPTVMRQQLTWLTELAQQPNISLQVLPFTRGSHPDLAGSFIILGFAWPDDPGVVYLEGRSDAEYLEAPHEVQDYTQVFEHLAALALPPPESITFIQHIIKEHQ